MKIEDTIISNYDGRDISIYATKNYIKNILADNDIVLHEDSNYDVLDNSGYAILSRTVYEDEDVWILEEMIHEDNEQYSNETDVLFIEETIEDDVDFRKIDFNELVILESGYIDELLEEMTEDLLDEMINSGEYIHCLIKD